MQSQSDFAMANRLLRGRSLQFILPLIIGFVLGSMFASTSLWTSPSSPSVSWGDRLPLHRQGGGSAFCIAPDGSASDSLSCRQSDSFFSVPDERWQSSMRWFDFQLAQSSIANETGHFYFQANAHPDIGCTNIRRVGNQDDGGKFICDFSTMVIQAERIGKPLLVYSLGSNGDFSFEVAILDLVPNAVIHTFDIDVYKTPRSEIVFHHWGIKAEGSSLGDISKPHKTLVDTFAALGHDASTSIDIFKMDIEGGEFLVLLPLLPPMTPAAESPLLRIRVFLLEVHFTKEYAQYWGTTSDAVSRFLKGMAEIGFALYMKEPNIAFTNGGCVELAWVRVHSRAKRRALL